PPVAMRDQIDRVGRAAGKYDLAFLGRVDERLDLAPGALVLGGSNLREVVHRAVDVGVLSRLIADPAVENGLWHLARRRVVEEYQRLAVHPGAQDRKVGAIALDVEPRLALLQCGMRCVHEFPADCVCIITMFSSCSTSDCTGMRSISSAPNA